MADEKDKDRDTSKDKKVDVEATAKVSDDEGEQTHQVDVKATADVKDLREKQEEKAAEKAAEEKNCLECGDSLTRVGNQWKCTNPDCPTAQAQASVAADRPTAKVAVAQTSRSFASSGRPD